VLGGELNETQRAEIDRGLDVEAHSRELFELLANHARLCGRIDPVSRVLRHEHFGRPHPKTQGERVGRARRRLTAAASTSASPTCAITSVTAIDALLPVSGRVRIEFGYARTTRIRSRPPDAAMRRSVRLMRAQPTYRYHLTTLDTLLSN
jgi:hypothetical protein